MLIMTNLIMLLSHQYLTTTFLFIIVIQDVIQAQDLQAKIVSSKHRETTGTIADTSAISQWITRTVPVPNQLQTISKSQPISTTVVSKGVLPTTGIIPKGFVPAPPPTKANPILGPFPPVVRSPSLPVMIPSLPTTKVTSPTVVVASPVIKTPPIFVPVPKVVPTTPILAPLPKVTQVSPVLPAPVPKLVPPVAVPLPKVTPVSPVLPAPVPKLVPPVAVPLPKVTPVSPILPAPVPKLVVPPVAVKVPTPTVTPPSARKSPSAREYSAPTNAPVPKVATPIAAPPQIKPTTAAVPIPVSKPVIDTTDTRDITDLPIRINCGFNSDWVDPKTNLRWLADEGYDKYITQGVVEDFCGTMEAVWCSYRFGYEINYTIPVLPERERYKITFLFLDPIYSTTGSRIMDIYVEGILMEPKVDVVALAKGRRKNTTVSVSTDKIKDSVISITLRGVKGSDGIQKCLVQGIIIEKSPYRLQGDFPIRINSGTYKEWVDPVTKNTWLADTDFDKRTSLNMSAACGTRVNDEQIYCSYRIGSEINYAIRVLDAELRYKVTFFVQEPSFVVEGMRLMDVTVQNKTVATGFDVVKYGGGKMKPVSFTITSDKVTNGLLYVNLKTTKNGSGQKCILSGLLVERAV